MKDDALSMHSDDLHLGQMFRAAETKRRRYWYWIGAGMLAASVVVLVARLRGSL
jgi:hypothetical protein